METPLIVLALVAATLALVLAASWNSSPDRQAGWTWDDGITIDAS
jgi:hypothetical protein